MRFNQKALYALAEKCEEGFDREGVLFIKEYTGLFRRRNYVQRWFKLKGNILFYLKTQEKTSIPVGALLLENCRVRIDPSNEKSPFAFVLLFESDSSPCSFFCLSDKDRQEWVAALKRASYEDLRVTLFDLRSKLMDLTGEDPLVEDSCSFSPPKDPIEDKSSKPSSSLSLIDEPLGFSIPDVSPVLELSLSCRDLFHPSGIIHFNTFCVLSTMTPPQSAWSKHAQTEVAESNRNPQYFTNVTFFAGNISMITQIKVSVYYVKEKGVDSATPLLLGNTQFTVSDIVTAKQQKVERLLKLRGCSTSTGSVTVQAWKMVESPESVRRFTSPLVRCSTIK
ncbi:uncharacterized protein LOC134190254 [Corticium candelabrum]|uniref:uncharacterized protein LOC134190254 n=1 Tax=Corticium candelabrum TaxID=121492 RepID=UPI002E26BF3B|nr:uncharacterized protein LOC134190254 [Corticium candelabrum]